LVAVAGFSSTAATQELITLHSFTGDDGAHPQADLIADPAGNLYGTTAGGGAGTSCIQGCGMIMGGAGNSTARPWPGTALARQDKAAIRGWFAGCQLIAQVEEPGPTRNPHTGP